MNSHMCFVSFSLFPYSFLGEQTGRGHGDRLPANGVDFPPQRAVLLRSGRQRINQVLHYEDEDEHPGRRGALYIISTLWRFPLNFRRRKFGATEAFFFFFFLNGRKAFLIFEQKIPQFCSPLKYSDGAISLNKCEVQKSVNVTWRDGSSSFVVVVPSRLLLTNRPIRCRRLQGS